MDIENIEKPRFSGAIWNNSEILCSEQTNTVRVCLSVILVSLNVSRQSNFRCKFLSRSTITDEGYWINGQKDKAERP